MTSFMKTLTTFFIIAFASCIVHAITEDELVEYLKDSAASGNSYALNDLGERYAAGDDVPQDDRKAVELFQTAAEQGHPRAQFNYGYMLSVGRGIPENDSEAFKWFLSSAKQCDYLAQFAVAVSYTEGIGIPQDKVQAYAWFNIVAAEGEPRMVKSKNWLAQEMTDAEIKEAQKLSPKLVKC